MRNDSNDSTSESSLDVASEPQVYTRDQHAISRQNIDSDALKIMYRLVRHGFKGYLVGGAVRDLLLQKRPKDYDIATDATPRQVKNLFRNCRIIGRRFKLAHVYFRGGKIIEVSTFRAPPEEDDHGGESERPDDNVYGDERSDAFRRDLTINALFYDLESFSIRDYIGGLNDLEKGVVRIIGTPSERFREDSVRMMRAIRHAARAGFTIDRPCLAAIGDLGELILQEPPMRLFEELKKDIIGGFFYPTLELHWQSGLLDWLVPALAERGREIFMPSSLLCKACTQADAFFRHVQNPEADGISVLLTLLFVLGTSSPQESLLPSEEFLSMEAISEFYASFLVPRKQKEKILDTLLLWRRVLEVEDEKLRSLHLERRKCLAELSLLLSWLDPENADLRVRLIIEDALTKRGSSSGKDTRRRSSHSRRRRPKRA